MRCAFPITPTTGRFIARLSLPGPQIRKRVVQPPEGLLEDRARRGEVEAQPCLAARPELLAGACKDARALCDPGRRPPRAAGRFRKNRPTRDRWRRAASSGRRAPRPRCAHRTDRGFRQGKAAAHRATPRRSARPPRSRSCRSRCRSPSPLAAIRASRRLFNAAFEVTQAPTWAPARLKVLVAATQVIRRSAISGAAVMVGVCLAPSKTRSQWISSETRIRSCSAQKAASARSSSADQTVPPGLCGLQRKTTFVRGVSLPRSASRSIA